jgi:hypothetical protein
LDNRRPFADWPVLCLDGFVRKGLQSVKMRYLTQFAPGLATVRKVLAGLTDEQLAAMTRPVTQPGYPEPASFPVRRCLRAILNEEWQHRLYAERDLDALERQPG